MFRFIPRKLRAYLFNKRYHFSRFEFNLVGLFFLTAGFAAGMYMLLANLIPAIFAAGDTSYVWNFSVPANYTVSNSNAIEVSGNAARLKVQNYSSDANTAALFHFDESSGNPDDASSNDNTATATSVTYSSGKLSNAANFNGTTSRVSVADTASLSITSAHSLEAWTKFSSAFSANSHTYNQTVLDKGVYQLYYDNETGKIVYELAPSNADNWAQAAGPDLVAANSNKVNQSWDLNGNNTVESQVVIGNDLYVGLGNAISDAEVWRCANCGTSPVWSQIGGDGVNSSWAAGTFEQVASMVTDGTNIYVGLGNSTLDAEVWRWNGTSWTKVGGDGVNNSWNTNYEIVSALALSGTTLFAGLGNSAGGDAEVWRCTSCDSSPAWGSAAIGGDGLNSSWANTTYEQVVSMVIAGTNLVAGLGTGAGDGEVWSTNVSTISWTKRGGDGTGTGGQSWGSVYETVSSLAASGNIIYVGLGVTAGEAEVWRCDLGATCNVTTGWTQVGGDGLNTSWNTVYERVWSLYANGTTVYAGVGESAGEAELWRCTSCNTSPSWSQIGGDGNIVPPQSWNNSFTHVHSIAMIGNYIFAGASHTTATSFGGEIWRCDTGGTCSATAGWSRIGGQYVNRSWGYFNLQSVESMTTANGKLYAGTGNAVAGNAQVWEFDGTAWTLIGGQGINSSWTAFTYETVPSMVAYNGNLVVGLGSGTGDGEVWSWNGTTWTKIGGDASGTGGQSWASAYEFIFSMAVYGGNLYIGAGNGSSESDVWRCTGSCTTTTGWAQIGGDTLNSSWAAGYDTVQSMTVHNGALIAGLGVTGGEAEIWSYNGSVWGKIGGDGTGSGGQSWASPTYEQVDSMASYNGELYVGLGTGSGEAEVWRCTGTCTTTTGWEKVGGDGINSSWVDTTPQYERVRALATFNGELFAGLGTTAGDAEVWKMDTSSTWTKVGGDGLNNGWSANMENVASLARYNGKLYAGVGDTGNADASIWAYGGNAILRSTGSSQDTNWHHIAATYDGATMKLYIDGTLDTSLTTSLTMLNTVQPLLMGSNFGNSETDISPGFFTGSIDEVRISNIARSSFNTTSFSNTAHTVQPITAVMTSQIKTWEGFTATESANGGTIAYRLSSDNGTTWRYWNGSSWSTSSSTAQSNTASTVNTNISSFPVGTSGILWQAVLTGDGNQEVTLQGIEITASSDATPPSNPNSLTSLSFSPGGSAITTNTWYKHTAPFFSWTGADDGSGSGIGGYFVYFGTDNSADPETAGAFQAASFYTPSSMVSGNTYYLRIKTRDAASNVSGTTWAPFIYKYDASEPVNPSTITVSPAGYATTNNFTFSWAAGSDTGSGIAGYQYKTATASGDLSDWSNTTTNTSVAIPNAAYQTGENTFYLRTVDNAGNVNSSSTQVLYYFGGEGPSAPQLLAVTPQTNTLNSFAFSWSAPVTYSGAASSLTYCYTVNTLPSSTSCTFTSAGATSITAGPFATQVGINTFYLVAKNSTENGGSINYGNYASVTFTANTAAPGIPRSLDIADVSVKSSSSWKLAISWEAPSDTGSGVSNYEIYRSTDDVTYSEIAATTGIAYVDTGLSQAPYYYKVRACDSVSNCGVFSEAVTLTPTGKYTEAPSLTSGPTVTSVTTKKATITWTTDRTSDSKVQYGTSPGSYFTEEPSNSSQLTDHKITMTNLIPGTQYYFRVRWTDEDGNTGTSSEKSFTTEASPTVTDPKVKVAGLTSVSLSYTVTGATKAKIYYGKTTAFGGITTVSTATAESAYVTTIEELEDGTKYFYKINTIDSEGAEYEGSILSFETLPRPKISTVRIQQVKGTAQSTLLVSWITNTEVSSIVTYYPVGAPSSARDEVNVQLKKGEHQMIIRGLLPQTQYALQVKGRDKSGNEAVSDIQRITTATDTRPPQVSELNVEGSIIRSSGSQGRNQTSQLVVTWNTDEPSTSQVEFGEGTGTTYSQKTQEDANLTNNHLVVISGLLPSKVYHLRVVSKDKANNEGYSVDTVTITPKATDDALDLVISSLSEVFGFLRGK